MQLQTSSKYSVLSLPILRVQLGKFGTNQQASGRILCNLQVMDKDESDLDCLDSIEEKTKAKWKMKFPGLRVQTLCLDQTSLLLCDITKKDTASHFIPVLKVIVKK